MTNTTTASILPAATGLSFGLDISDREGAVIAVDPAGSIIEEVRLKMTEPALQAYFSRKARSRVVLEAGTHSPWVKRLLAGLGHEAVVLNPHRVRLIAESVGKTDRVDALTLAELGRMGTRLIQVVSHHSEEVQADLQILRSRALMVELRTKCINHARAVVKTAGGRIVGGNASSFHRKALEQIPEALQEALTPVLLEIANATHHIQQYDRLVARLIAERYPAAALLQTIPGIGPITSLTFVLTIERPERFGRARQVGKYFGLTPGIRQSGKRNQSLSITRAGDSEMRRLLVQAAHSMLRCPSADGDLRRWALAKAEASGGARKRAVVALARKLAVLMLAIWKSGAAYQPFRDMSWAAVPASS